MISHNHRCIFVHIPKTGGKSVLHALGARWQDHKDLQQYARELPPETFSGYYKFTVVRNPWARLVSEYNFQWQKRRSRESKLFIFDERGALRTFPEWVRVAMSHPDRYDCRQWGGDVSPGIHRWSPQVDWVRVDGRVGVDFVARLENLESDFQQICQRIGLSGLRLPHKNRKLHWHYSHYYDAETRALVGDYYAEDIKAFGYTFETGSGLQRIGKQIADQFLRLLEPRNGKRPETPGEACNAG